MTGPLDMMWVDYQLYGRGYSKIGTKVKNKLLIIIVYQCHVYKCASSKVDGTEKKLIDW